MKNEEENACQDICFCCFYGYLMIVRQHLQLWQENREKKRVSLPGKYIPAGIITRFIDTYYYRDRKYASIIKNLQKIQLCTKKICLKKPTKSCIILPIWAEV